MTSDILIIGSGAAGLTAALTLADRFTVTVLAKGALNEGSTAWAQGGIAAVLEPGDTFEHHVEDTMVAGAGLNDRAIVELVVEHGFSSGALERQSSDPGHSKGLHADGHCNAYPERLVCIVAGSDRREGQTVRVMSH